MSKTRPDQGIDAISRIQEATLNTLFAPDRMQRFIETNAKFPASYSMDELFTDVRTSIWSELRSRKIIDASRRNLQKIFVEKMIATLNATGVTPSFGGGGRGSVVPLAVDPRKTDIISVTRGHLSALKDDIKTALMQPTLDKMTKYHLQDCMFRIGKALDPKS